MFFITNGIDGYKRAFCYKGVADRKSYFFFVLFQTPISVLMIWVSIYLESISQSLNEDTPIGHPSIILLFSLAQLAASIYIFLASLAFAVRRLHDIDLSGWWVILIFCMTFIFAVFIMLWALITGWEASLRKENSFLPDYIWGEYISSIWQFQWGLYIFNFVFNFLLALPKSKIENNKYRPADSISITATMKP